MRPIKFRFWDKRNKIMVEGKELVFWNGNVYRNESGSLYDKNHKLARLRGSDYVMQFTGIQDKNGVDVYEGDIVSMHQFLFDGNEVEKVISGIIGCDKYGWTLRQIRNEFIEEYCGYDAGEGEISLNSFYGLHEESWEILGNIHENPELLGGAK